MYFEPSQEAFTGDMVGFSVKQIKYEDIRRGHVVSDIKNDPARECINFNAQVIIINHPG